jgi:Secretion system C-terminal sorting domain/Carboxylesterase family
MRSLVLLFFLFSITFAKAQQYLQKQYSFVVDSNVVYAVDTNYLGFPENLTLHIYKPVGDANLQRPILIYVHGGSWLGGTPNDYYPTKVSEEFVKRGYVVANIQYRMGMHTNPLIAPGTNCPLIAGNAQCAYIADSAEVLRASFRAMQDAKSAIRFMKNRASQDSSCSKAVFIAGESAGAFTALGASFLDKQSERFNVCGSISSAPATSTNLAFCQLLFDHLPTGQIPNYNRPDLGSIEGSTNLNGQNSKVKAVASFYGAVFSEAVSKDWINGADTPLVYLFHQGNDFVVSCGSASPIMTLNNCIPFVNLGFNDCVGYSNVPFAYGSCAISNYFQSINYTNFKFDFVNNWIGNPLIDCANTAQPGQGHNIDNIALRCDSVAKLFSPLAISASINCLSTGWREQNESKVFVFPNPAKNKVYIDLPHEEVIQRITIRNCLGNEQHNYRFTKNEIQVESLQSGVYILEVVSKEKKYFSKLWIQ